MERVAPLTDRPTMPVRHTHSQNGGRPPAASALMPVLVLAAAFALGVVVARVLDWRTHAHPDR